MSWKKLAGKAIDVVDDLVADKDLAAKLKADITMALMDAQKDVIIAESGGGWLQRNWRPIMMMVFVYIIANNYILVPYAAAVGLTIPSLEIPAGMWNLLTVGLGGYVASRGFEKTAKIKRGEL